MMCEPLEHLKRIVGRTEVMYVSMATALGHLVKCDNCGHEQSVNPVKCLRTGWPQCCGYTMTLQPQEPDDDSSTEAK
jgi:hypothetical protein